MIALYNGGTLTTVNNAAENTWLKDNMTGGTNRWIGYNDAATEGAWVWTNGETPGYANWNGGEPNDAGTGEDYAQIGASGGWNDVGSAATAQGIVELTARNLNDSQRFNPANGKLYSQTDSLTWADARAQAQNWGGDLATVHNATENEFMRANIGAGWIGFNDAATEGTWVWAKGDGGTWSPSNWSGGTSYHNWNHPLDNPSSTGNEPNGGSGENYAELRSDGMWNDLGATAYRYGVAEKTAAPPRWIRDPATGRWYAQTANLTWADAEAQAQYWGVHLATINDAAEQTYVADKFPNTWIGFTDDENYGGTEYGDTHGAAYPPGGNRGAGWVWTSGEPVTYQNWGSTEPNNSSNEDYAQIRTTGWNDYGVRHLDGVAEADADAALASAQFVDGLAPGLRYALLGQMTWEDAEAAAQALGGHLVTVRSQAENNYLQSIARDILGGNIWLGYTDKVNEGDFQWVGYDPTSFTHWNSGEPSDSGGNEDYTTMYASSGLWNDANGTALAYAVVEFVPEPSTMVLAGAGLALLAAFGWRRRKG